MKTNPGASPLLPTKFHSGLAKPATLLSPLPGANLFNISLGCRICNQQGLRSCLRLPGPCRAGFQEGILSLCTIGPHRLANNSLLLVPRLGVGAWESLKAAKYSFPRADSFHWAQGITSDIHRSHTMSHREIWKRNIPPPTPAK